MRKISKKGGRGSSLKLLLKKTELSTPLALPKGSRGSFKSKRARSKQ